jgi:transcriptional regulator GlxA family with amidase domain
VARIRQAGGQVSVDALARGLGWTRRRLQRAFARDLGVSPKLYARIVRLNSVLATLAEPERARFVDLALEAGYFDQAHLLRDFRLLAGRSPRVSRAADGELARHFTDPSRLRTLLAGD